MIPVVLDPGSIYCASGDGAQRCNMSQGGAMGLLDKLFGSGKKDSGPTLTYKVGVSDTCRSVAKKFYGDESQWEKVYKPNEWRLKEEVQSGTDKLLPGTELTIKGAKYGLDGQPL
jgi:hypothetical protein